MIDPASDISVVLATYNGSRFLGEQLHSIAAQTQLPAELLVFDDGSAPSELEAIRAIVARYPGATLISGANVGITANFARAIAAAQCSYIALADQDDVWTPDHLAVLRDAIGPADLVYGDMLFMNADGQVSGERFSDRIGTMGLTSGDPAMFDALLHGSVIWGTAALFRRDLLNDRAMVETRRYHDWWLSMLALMRNGIRYVDHVLVHHRIHAANSSHHRDEQTGLRALFGSAKGERRRLQAERALACLDAVRQGGFALDARQRAALVRAEAYARSLLADDRRLWRTGYALQQRHIMGAGLSPMRQIAVAFTKLV